MIDIKIVKAIEHVANMSPGGFELVEGSDTISVTIGPSVKDEMLVVMDAAGFAKPKVLPAAPCVHLPRVRITAKLKAQFGGQR